MVCSLKLFGAPGATYHVDPWPRENEDNGRSSNEDTCTQRQGEGGMERLKKRVQEKTNNGLAGRKTENASTC